MNAFSTVEETRHGGDWLTMVYSQSGQRTQCAVKIDVINLKKKHANCIKKRILQTARQRKMSRVIARDHCIKPHYFIRISEIKGNCTAFTFFGMFQLYRAKSAVKFRVNKEIWLTAMHSMI